MAGGSPSQSQSPGALVDQLRKVLRLEQSKGFTNTAVVGGLDRFLERWGAEAQRAMAHPMLRSGLQRLELTAPAYGAKAAGERAGWVEQVLEWTEGLGGEPPRQVGTPPQALVETETRPPARSSAAKPSRAMPAKAPPP